MKLLNQPLSRLGTNYISFTYLKMLLNSISNIISNDILSSKMSFTTILLINTNQKNLFNFLKYQPIKTILICNLFMGTRYAYQVLKLYLQM